jgi:protein AroM
MAWAVAAVTIGQSPRPDLIEALLARLPDDVEVLEIGALDLLSAESLPRPARSRETASPAYPLTTRLRDGTAVIVDEADLAPLVQAAIAKAEASGARVILLLCAGGFEGAKSDRPLVRPFDAAMARLRAMHARRIQVVVPFAGQAEAAARKWRSAGFDPVTIVGDPAGLASSQAGTHSSAPSSPAFDALVLDYVGHPSATVQRLRARTTVPLVDLGECGADAVAHQIGDDPAARTSGA